MSRTIFGVALVLGLVLVVGCGSKSEPTLPKVSLESEAAPSPGPTPVSPTNPDPVPPAIPKVEPPKEPSWEMDPDKHVLPATPLKGRVAGAEVAPEVSLEGDELLFRQKTGTPVVERSVKLKLAPMLIAGQTIPSVLGRGWKVRPENEPGPNVPQVWLTVPDKGLLFFPSNYALTLELGTRKDGKVAGRIYFCLLGDEKTILAGTFLANYTRSPVESPGPEEVPYVTGEVSAVGAKPGAEIRIGFAGFTEANIVFKEQQLPIRPTAEQNAVSTRDDTTTLVRGELDGQRFRYEHVKLPPGRYLLTAAVSDGPTVWKWVDIVAGSALTENFTIDATKVGSVEVSLPVGVTGKLLLAPADDPAKPALHPNVFHSLALHAVRQEFDIVAGKATAKNLAPGKYEVRAGQDSRVVEVVAGKVAELDMTPPKKP